MFTNLNAVEKSISSFLTDLSKVREKEHGWKTSAARMRKESLELEKLLKQFRKVSVYEAKKGTDRS